MHQISDFSRMTESKSAYAAGSINLLFYDLPKYFNDEYRTYDSPRLCTILEGSKELSVNQSENFIYKKDSFVLLPPHANVNLYMPEDTKALVYEFGDQIIDAVTQKVSEYLQIEVSSHVKYETFLLKALTKRIDALSKRIQEIFYENDVNKTFLIDLACQEMVYELLKIQGCHEIIYHHHHHPINRAIKLMNSSKGEFLSIHEIAEEVNMSHSNFSQQFKIIMNKTPKDYITALRLEKSKSYLNNLTVTDTAFELGYDNISHFIRLFKQEYGVTPKQYQMSQSVKLFDEKRLGNVKLG